MATPTPCVPCCTTPQVVNIPGIDGSNGATGPQGPQGPAGAPGALAINSTSGQPDPFSAAAAGFVGMSDTDPAIIITPTFSGRVLVTVSGTVGNTLSAATSTIQLRYDTGAAPAPAASPATGASAGNSKALKSPGTTSRIPFSATVLLTGLTLASAYWIDIYLTPSAGTASVQDLDVVAIEL